MSTDAFGNSPSMTHAEMRVLGLIDAAGDLTPKGDRALFYFANMGEPLGDREWKPPAHYWRCATDGCEHDRIPGREHCADHGGTT